MTQWLKQSTAATVKMGPFLDATDGDTEMTGLTISQADIRLTKNGGAFAQTNNAAGATHDENGFYGVPLDTTDTNTLGSLKVFIHEATALSVWQEFMVVPANVWDSFFGADKLQVHADEITAGLITAAAIATGAVDADALATDAVNEIVAAVKTALGIVSGTSDSGSTTTMVDAARTEADADYWKGSWILFTSGTMSGQCRQITGFNATTDTITFAPAVTQAVSTETYDLIPAGAADVRLWNGTVPNNLNSGRVDSITGAMASNVITSTALNANAATEIADAVVATAVDGTTTLAESLRLSNSALGGKLSGAGTGTETVRDLADSKDRLVYTVDNDGNRSAITRDLS